MKTISGNQLYQSANELWGDKSEPFMSQIKEFGCFFQELGVNFKVDSSKYRDTILIGCDGNNPCCACKTPRELCFFLDGMKIMLQWLRGD